MTSIKIVFCLALAVFSCKLTLAQRVGIGTTAPVSRLAVDSGLHIDQAGANPYGSLLSGLTFGTDKRVGFARNSSNTGNVQNGLDFYTDSLRRLSITSSGNVGIGTTVPGYLLDVNGEMRAISNLIVGGNLGIGTSSPLYDLHTSQGYFTNSIGVRTVPNSTYSIDVAGPVRIQNDMRVDGTLNPNNALTIGNNTTIEGSLTVNSNKGIVRSNSSTELKVVRTSVTLSATLGAGGAVDSGDFFYETFSATPIVVVGGLLTGTGSWQRVAFIPFDIGVNSCKFRVTNISGVSTGAVTATFQVLIIGPS